MPRGIDPPRDPWTGPHGAQVSSPGGVVCFLPDDGWIEFVKGLRSGFPIIRVLSGRALRQIGQSSLSTIVFDPSLLGSSSYQQLLEALKESGAPAVVYTRLESTIAARALMAADTLGAEIILRGDRADSSLLRTVLPVSRDRSALASLLQRAASRLALLPPPCMVLALAPFCWTRIPRTVGESCSDRDVNRRAAERAVNRAGFRGMKVLMDSARVARTWTLLSDSRSSLEDIAEFGGFGSAATFRQQVRALLETTPRRLVNLGIDGFVSRLFQRLIHGDASTPVE